MNRGVPAVEGLARVEHGGGGRMRDEVVGPELGAKGVREAWSQHHFREGPETVGDVLITQAEDFPALIATKSS